ncbi:response regulator [Nonlabens mediterrranea]|uniref:Response regulator n=1 Tax=Nonlabens mediterrranea TaxID=1419947 RepID=A0ABS0A0G6_9FLAO|nr:putative response regulator protein [Flavobacteria bacterium BBFL7]MBF4982829.1 response regulator [Nonlabens mediterrranea]
MSITTIRRACIIDDDRLYVSLIKMLINKNKLAQELLIFENGKQAFDYFESALESGNIDVLPQVVLLDLNMPIMDGWEFLEALEPYADKLKACCLKLNVVSSTINPEEMTKARNHDIVNDFITKPISKDAMISAFKA